MKNIKVLLLLISILIYGCSSSEENSVILERPLGVEILSNGDYLVTDGGGAYMWDNSGSKVFILNSKKRVKWFYDQGLKFAHSAIMLKNGNVLIPDTNNNRLLEVNMKKEVVWDSSKVIPLDYPNHVVELDNGHFLVSDRDNSRVIEIDRDGEVFWSYDQASRQHAPRSLKNGNIILADSEGNRIIEVNREGEVVWSYSRGLKWPRRADRLENGNTLITDSRNHRVLEVTNSGEVVKEYKSNFGTPYEAQKLDNGNILVCDSQHGRIVEVDGDSQIVWEFSNIVFPDYPEVPLGLDMEFETINDSPWYIADMVAHNPGTWEIDRSKSHKGNQSLKIYTESKKRPTKRWWGQRISVEPGDSINIFGRVSTDLEAGGAGISITWIDSLGGSRGGVNSDVISGNSDWTPVSLQVSVPENISYAEISLSMVGIGSAWFDSVEFGKEL